MMRLVFDILVSDDDMIINLKRETAPIILVTAEGSYYMWVLLFGHDN